MREQSLQEKIEIMQAYLEGKVIESCTGEDRRWEMSWMYNPVPGWNWTNSLYRVMPVENKEEVQQEVEILKAFQNGKKIQVATVAGWEDDEEPIWDFVHKTYRIKPEE